MNRLVHVTDCRGEPQFVNSEGRDVCDTAVRQAGQRESYDLHSFTVSGAGISETVGDYPSEPHPAGPIVREATVRLVLVRHIPLEPDCASSSAPQTAQRGLA